MTEPEELAYARWLLGSCERFGCLPSQLLDEDAGLLRLQQIEALGRGGETGGHEGL